MPSSTRSDAPCARGAEPGGELQRELVRETTPVDRRGHRVRSGLHAAMVTVVRSQVRRPPRGFGERREALAAVSDRCVADRAGPGSARGAGERRDALPSAEWVSTVVPRPSQQAIATRVRALE